MSECPFRKERDEEDEENISRFPATNADLTPTSALTYDDYLQLDRLLALQNPRSAVLGSREAPDEHLFIAVHQIFELWFRISLNAIDRCRRLLKAPFHLTESSTINRQLERVIHVFKQCLEQMTVVETITALDFLEFREHLGSASGAQSHQFSLIERKLGVRKKSQHTTNASQAAHEKSANDPTLFDALNDWLAKMPLEEVRPLWNAYVQGVRRYLNALEAESTSPESYQKTKAGFEQILDERRYSQSGHRMSYSAFKSAMIIQLHRAQSQFAVPYLMLTHLMDVDSLLMKWRFAHMMLVLRMLGCKEGTGGSSGYLYLHSTTGRDSLAFPDLFNLSTWLIPRHFYEIPANEEQKSRPERRR